MSIKYQELKEELQARRDRLAVEIEGLKTAPGATVGYGNHMADDASYAFEQTKSLALHENLRTLLVQVNEALVRFENGTFGVCENCGQSIDPARLEAIPYAPLCIHCAQNSK